MKLFFRPVSAFSSLLDCANWRYHSVLSAWLMGHQVYLRTYTKFVASLILFDSLTCHPIWASYWNASILFSSTKEVKLIFFFLFLFLNVAAFSSNYYSTWLLLVATWLTNSCLAFLRLSKFISHSGKLYKWIFFHSNPPEKL